MDRDPAGLRFSDASSTQATSYLRLDPDGGVEEMWTHLFSPSGTRLAKTNLMTDAVEWFPHREGDGPLTLTATYVQDLAIDAKYIKLDTDGEQHNLLLDALSSVGATTDAPTATVETHLKIAWGETQWLHLPEKPRIGFGNLRPSPGQKPWN